MRDEPNAELRRLNRRSSDPQKVLVDPDSRTVAMEVETAKECVTTHLPNQLALKMDGAQASCLYSAVKANGEALTSRRAWGS